MIRGGGPARPDAPAPTIPRPPRRTTGRPTTSTHPESLAMTPLVLGLALTLGAPGSKKTDDPPPGKIDGDWVVESFEGPKNDAPPGAITFHFVADKISITEPARNG